MPKLARTDELASRVLALQADGMRGTDIARALNLSTGYVSYLKSGQRDGTQLISGEKMRRKCLQCDTPFTGERFIRLCNECKK